jgi:hypothetical protein
MAHLQSLLKILTIKLLTSANPFVASDFTGEKICANLRNKITKKSF